MANITISVTAENAMLDAFARLLDGGSIQIFTGSPPASLGAITSQVLLATHTLSNPSAPAAASRVLTFSAIGDDIDIDATGTAGWHRAFKSDGTTIVFDGTCTATGGGGVLTFPTVSFVQHAKAQITSYTITGQNT